MSEYEWTDSAWEVPARSGHTMSAAVGRFLAGEAARFVGGRTAISGTDTES